MHQITGPSVFGQALSSGKTARVYAESMAASCTSIDSGDYATRHNPWTYFVDEQVECKAHDAPLAALIGDVSSGNLPNAGMVVPNLCHDAHDCDLGVADTWLRTEVGAVMSGPDWASGHLAIAPLTHYSLARMYGEVLGTPPLREAAKAPSMMTAFGLTG